MAVKKECKPRRPKPQPKAEWNPCTEICPLSKIGQVREESEKWWRKEPLNEDELAKISTMPRTIRDIAFTSHPSMPPLYPSPTGIYPSPSYHVYDYPPPPFPITSPYSTTRFSPSRMQTDYFPNYSYPSSGPMQISRSFSPPSRTRTWSTHISPSIRSISPTYDQFSSLAHPVSTATAFSAKRKCVSCAITRNRDEYPPDCLTCYHCRKYGVAPTPVYDHYPIAQDIVHRNRSISPNGTTPLTILASSMKPSNEGTALELVRRSRSLSPPKIRSFNKDDHVDGKSFALVPYNSSPRQAHFANLNSVTIPSRSTEQSRITLSNINGRMSPSYPHSYGNVARSNSSSLQTNGFTRIGDEWRRNDSIIVAAAPPKAITLDHWPIEKDDKKYPTLVSAPERKELMDLESKFGERISELYESSKKSKDSNLSLARPNSGFDDGPELLGALAATEHTRALFLAVTRWIEEQMEDLELLNLFLQFLDHDHRLLGKIDAHQATKLVAILCDTTDQHASYRVNALVVSKSTSHFDPSKTIQNDSNSTFIFEDLVEWWTLPNAQKLDRPSGFIHGCKKIVHKCRRWSLDGNLTKRLDVLAENKLQIGIENYLNVLWYMTQRKVENWVMDAIKIERERRINARKAKYSVDELLRLKYTFANACGMILGMSDFLTYHDGLGSVDRQNRESLSICTLPQSRLGHLCRRPPLNYDLTYSVASMTRFQYPWQMDFETFLLWWTCRPESGKL